VLTEKKSSCQHTVLTEETVDSVRAQLEHIPHESPRWLTQEQEFQESLQGE
jgi:hypothetical protein